MANKAIKFVPAFGLHRTPLSGRRLLLALKVIEIAGMEIVMGWLLIYMISLYALWHAIDMEANSVFENAIAPFAFALVLIAFLIWLRSKVGGGSSSSNGGAGGSWGGGGDGGGGC